VKRDEEQDTRRVTRAYCIGLYGAVLLLLGELFGFSGTPPLLGRALASGIGKVQMLDPVFLVVVNQLVLGVQRPQLADGADAWRIVGDNGRAAQALV